MGISARMSRRVSSPMDPGEQGICLICFSHVFWDMAAWQRNHHVMSRFSKEFPVIYCRPVSVANIAKDPGKDFQIGVKMMSNRLTLMVPLLFPGEHRFKLVKKLNQWILENITEKTLQDMGIAGRKRILWFYYPRWVYMVGEMKESLVVYDIQDEYLTQFNAPFNIDALEKSLLNVSDIIFTGTKSLERKKGKERQNIKFVPCGVDYDHFHSASDENVSLAPEMKSLKKPVLGYIGWIGERVDLELIYYLAERRPDWSVVDGGPCGCRSRAVDAERPFPGKEGLSGTT